MLFCYRHTCFLSSFYTDFLLSLKSFSTIKFILMLFYYHYTYFLSSFYCDFTKFEKGCFFDQYLRNNVTLMTNFVQTLFEKTASLKHFFYDNTKCEAYFNEHDHTSSEEAFFL